jgi:predicted enzyme related to lactoylglutathione lyase
MSPASGEDAGPGLDGLGGENAAAAGHGLPYFAVDDLVAALKRVNVNGGAVVHPGEGWAICRDSEGSLFALADVDSCAAGRPLCATNRRP